MKKLVCASDIKSASDKGQKVICVDCSTIITPAAKDLAKELGVELLAETSRCKDGGVQKKDRQVKEIDRDIIYQIVKAALLRHLAASGSDAPPESPFQADCDPKSGLKIIRGSSVKYETFDTGNPSASAAYREVISKDDSKMSAGFLTIEKSSFDWELCYEEVDIILEGSLSIAINGRTYYASQGDVLFIPRGSKVTWSTSGHVKLFYVTYPANWSDLMAQQ